MDERTGPGRKSSTMKDSQQATNCLVTYREFSILRGKDFQDQIARRPAIVKCKLTSHQSGRDDDSRHVLQ